ncbi:MAG: hypothetical protein AUJ51_12840 [Elusimicrobia bacterium CG1_02_56_21]|nr:MAG: hypothetical protein AUJ51_12840 [Elusimicrobia bacterium CG1_02_56_21]
MEQNIRFFSIKVFLSKVRLYKIANIRSKISSYSPLALFNRVPGISSRTCRVYFGIKRPDFLLLYP